MDAYAHKADKSKVDIGSALTAPDAPQNADEFYFDYQDGKYGFNTDPDRGSSTFHPFEKGAILLGEYSANATIDVSALGATSVSQFIVNCPTTKTDTHTSGTHTGWGDNPIEWSCTYTPPSLSLSGNTLTLSVGNIHYGGHTSNTAIYNWTDVSIPCRVYFVGDIESAS